MNDGAIPLSAIQHYSYCPRQCALIHVEQTFDENLYTLRGRAVHEQVDTPDSSPEHGKRIERALPLYSERLGLTGKADVVEFLADGTPLSGRVQARQTPPQAARRLAACRPGHVPGGHDRIFRPQRRHLPSQLAPPPRSRNHPGTASRSRATDSPDPGHAGRRATATRSCLCCRQNAQLPAGTAYKPGSWRGSYAVTWRAICRS